MKTSGKRFTTSGMFLTKLSVTAMVLFVATAATGGNISPAGAKPAKPTITILSGGAEGDLKLLREAIEKVPGVKFKPEELKFADFGRDGGKFTSFLPIELDLGKSDLGALAKSVAATPTSNKEKCPPALFLIVKYRPDSTKNEPFRAALSKVKGVQPAKSWVGDANLWVSVDGSGQTKLAEVTRALHDAGIKIRDPILDVGD